MKDDKENEQTVPTLRCWFCDHDFTVAQVVRDGILRSRSGSEGGPFRLFFCPACSKENLCEKSAKGRWFASPNCRLSFLDYIFSQFLDSGTASAETLLAAISWLRENEERRRYLFELDGDRRYSQESWLKRLWPGARAEETAASGHTTEGSARKARESGPRERAEGEPGRATPSTGRRFIAPHEILGVSPDASAEEIRLAFRRLAVQYHPDKVSHLGEEFERMAHEKFLWLKDAYETLIARKRTQN